MTYTTTKVINSLYLDIKYIGQNFLSHIVPFAIGLTTAGIALHSEIMPKYISSSASARTTSLFSKFNLFSYGVKHIVAHTKYSFTEKAYDNAVTDAAYPLMSSVASLVASKSQYSLFDKTYTKAMFVGIASAEAYNIYSCLTTSVHRHNKAPFVAKHVAKLLKVMLVDLELVVPAMHSVNDIFNSPKMTIGDKALYSAVEEVKAIGASFAADTLMDYMLPG